MWLSETVKLLVCRQFTVTQEIPQAIHIRVESFVSCLFFFKDNYEKCNLILVVWTTVVCAHVSESSVRPILTDCERLQLKFHSTSLLKRINFIHYKMEYCIQTGEYNIQGRRNLCSLLLSLDSFHGSVSQPYLSSRL